MTQIFRCFIVTETNGVLLLSFLTWWAWMWFNYFWDFFSLKHSLIHNFTALKSIVYENAMLLNHCLLCNSHLHDSHNLFGLEIILEFTESCYNSWGCRGKYWHLSKVSDYYNIGSSLLFKTSSLFGYLDTIHLLFQHMSPLFILPYLLNFLTREKKTKHSFFNLSLFCSHSLVFFFRLISS